MLKDKKELLMEQLRSYQGKGKKYDFVVSFSGGKDSTYIANLLKQTGFERVLLLTVDNGVEEEIFLDYVSDVAKKIGYDHYIIKPNLDNFRVAIKTMIEEKTFMKYDSNPICFFCTEFMVALSKQYAMDEEIPVLLHGMSPEQFHLGFTNKMFELKDKTFLRNQRFSLQIMNQGQQQMYESIQKEELYQTKREIKEFIDFLYIERPGVNVIYPYLFIEYNIEQIKQVIEKDLGWKNIYGVRNDQYITSGCELIRILGFMQGKVDGLQLHENKEIENNYKDGIVSDAAYEFYSQQLKFDESIELTKHQKEIINDMDLWDYLNIEK